MLGPLGEDEAEAGDGTADKTLVQEEGGDGGRKAAVATDSGPPTRAVRAASVDAIVVLVHLALASSSARGGFRQLTGTAPGTRWGRRRTAGIAGGGPVRVGCQRVARSGPVVAQRAAGVIRVADHRFRYLRIGRGRRPGARHAGVARQYGGVVVRLSAGHGVVVAATLALALAVVAAPAETKAGKDLLRGLIVGISTAGTEAGLRRCLLRLGSGDCSGSIFARHLTLSRRAPFLDYDAEVIQGHEEMQTSIPKILTPEKATNDRSTRCVFSARRRPTPDTIRYPGSRLSAP
mmetsp:Transcript_13459/g.38465  ORF Transcript_13459/g.38465 Transcript_13459/m.38465 type:complete len:291 (-) Transcript_13459:97-969(-)